MYIDGLVQERRKSSASAMELRLPCTNPSIYVRSKNFCLTILSSARCQTHFANTVGLSTYSTGM